MIPNCSGAAGSEEGRTISRSNSGEGGGGGGQGNTASLKKGPWTAAEDAILMEYVKKHGEGNWNAEQRNSGLSRCGKSCRLRWANHLRPNLKKGSFSPDEERLILELHAKLGNKWARMAAQITLNLARSNSGLLDDLLREAQAMSCGGDSRRLGLLGSENENGVFDGFGGNWDDSSSVHSPPRKKPKGEPLDQNNYMQEDFSNILGLFPSAMQVPLWYSDSGENSNGQLSGVTEDNIGLAMQQLTSSHPVAAAAAAAANWDNIPGICS